MEKKMETTIIHTGLYRDKGKEIETTILGSCGL